MSRLNGIVVRRARRPTESPTHPRALPRRVVGKYRRNVTIEVKKPLHSKDDRTLKFGRLTVLDDSTDIWTLKCDCGEVINRHKNRIKYGDSRSCGCLRRETTANKNRVHGLSKNNRVYRIWKHMRRRCNCKTDYHYKWYGERGIKVCDEWSSFENFYNWSIENGYEEKLTIDRIDNDGGYEPNNCRWVTQLVQNNNTRNVRKIEILGIEDSISNHARRFGVDRRTISRRYKMGLRENDLIKPPRGNAKHG